MNLVNLNNQLAVIQVTGPDSAKYLQGQVTNDINLLTILTLEDNVIHASDRIHHLQQEGFQKYQFAAHLNHKGRMLANFIIIRPNTDTFYLITNKELVAQILARIKMFVMRSKVEITVLEKNIILSTNVIPNELNIAIDTNVFIVISDNSYDTTGSLSIWNDYLIKNGITLIHPSTVEKLIPQQVNLERLNAISFTKGCYTGQEIVARTHYLGKIKRKLFKFEATTNNNIVIGQIVVSPKMNNQEVGIIVEVSKNYGLVSAQTDCIDEIFLDIDNKIRLKITDIN